MTTRKRSLHSAESLILITSIVDVLKDETMCTLTLLMMALKNETIHKLSFCNVQRARSAIVGKSEFVELSCGVGAW